MYEGYEDGMGTAWSALMSDGSDWRWGKWREGYEWFEIHACVEAVRVEKVIDRCGEVEVGGMGSAAVDNRRWLGTMPMSAAMRGDRPSLRVFASFCLE